MQDIPRIARTGILCLAALAGVASCSAASRVVEEREYSAERRAVPSQPLPVERFRTRLVVDAAKGQVRELRYVTTALGAKLDPEISIWGKEHSGFASGSRSSCEIFDADNFLCQVWPEGFDKALAPLGSELRMVDGTLIERSGLDTIHYGNKWTPVF
jgi:hypothetical protein